MTGWLFEVLFFRDFWNRWLVVERLFVCLLVCSFVCLFLCVCCVRVSVCVWLVVWFVAGLFVSVLGCLFVCSRACLFDGLVDVASLYARLDARLFVYLID